MWRAATGRCEQIRTQGAWIGITEGSELQLKNQEYRFEPGDIMVVYTDGITEAKSAGGELYNLDRLCAVVERAHAKPTADICRDILDGVKQWAAEQADDQTLVVLRRQPT